MNRRVFVASLTGLILSASLALAGDKVLLNLDAKGVAIAGYYPVAFFSVEAPVQGKAEFSSEFRGARYWFHSAKSKAQFDAEPAKCEPQFGGYCAYGVSRGALVSIRIDAWQIVGGRLLMQKNQGIRDDFNEDPAGNLKKADANWPRLLEKKRR
jgi:YHS domain-containing protein